MKSDKVIRWFDAGIWPGTVLFSCGFTYDELMKQLLKKKAKWWAVAINDDKVLIDSGNYFALKRVLTHKKTGKQTTYFFIILKNQFDFSDYMYCTLAHEILHICQFLLPEILNMEREYEAVAYTHTYLMENILKLLRGK